MDILAVPCNQFGRQEPGRGSEILAGIRHVRPGRGYRPNFNLTKKTEVNGRGQHLLYTFLKNHCPGTTSRLGNPANMFWEPISRDDLVWNFEKFLVDHHGYPVSRYHPSVAPQKLRYIISLLINKARKEE